MANVNYNVNLFEDSADYSDGSRLGPSRSIIGNGNPVAIALHNPGNALVVMQTRPVVSANNTDPKWANIGGTVSADKQRLNLLLAGYEYRVYVLDEAASGLKARFIVYPMNSVSPLWDDLNDPLTAFAGSTFAGLATRDDNDLVDVGNLDALKQTNAPLFVCYSADAAEMAFFGGLWVRSSGDYVKQQINTSQLFLTTAIANYPLVDIPETGTGTTGGVGQPPIDRSASGTVSYIDSADASFAFNIYSSSAGEVLWPKHPTEAVGDYYELTLNGIVVVQEQKYAHSFTNLQPSTQYIVTLRFIRANGDYSDAAVSTKTTPATGVTTTTGTTPTSDGALTTDPYWVIDAASTVYETPGANGQLWVKTTGDDTSSGVGVLSLQGATESAGNGAKGFLQQVAQNSSAPDETRRIWGRARATTSASILYARSAGNGIIGNAIVDDSDFQWVEFSEPYQPYDSELQVQGGTTGVEVDKFILMLASDTTVPTGADGLRSS